MSENKIEEEQQDDAFEMFDDLAEEEDQVDSIQEEDNKIIPESQAMDMK